ncbi:heterogeneous nuclear ribonucleoprotein 1-like [Phoenix dactylifera]|uniref:Heterogeneous nuclear ribonucleoprotein 1-like n=1 Tax=Phoenix dactylifera TaxID=42345 RepID=A0A8B7C2L0_PHODC|nr:heterogeneous nuclear ribonucleoprotein 1-like [Phoenix dactylifera]
MMEPSTSYSPSSSAASSSSSWNEVKLFVGGISGETTEHRLVEYFSKYGEVAWANVAENKITGRSRGFAFVRFVDSAAAERALAETREHVILGRKVEVKKAIPKYLGYQNHHKEVNRIPFNPRKIFVGGLPPKLTEDEFSSFFEQFGEIKYAALMYDNFGRVRGFGFIEFHSVEAAEKVLQNRFYELKDKKVEVKKAVPKTAKNYNKEINSCLGDHMIIGGGGGYVFDDDQAGFYPLYDSRYEGLQHYVSPFFSSCAPQYSGYVVGCYGGIGYSSLYACPELVPAWNWYEV